MGAPEHEDFEQMLLNRDEGDLDQSDRQCTPRRQLECAQQSRWRAGQRRTGRPA
jgi:hypothetical protein